MYATIHAGNTGTSQGTQRQLTQQAAIILIKQFIKEVQANGLHIRHAVLFGSFARNEQHEWSDIDLALFADEFQSVRFLDNRLIQDIKIKKPYFDIETHTYNTADFGSGDSFIDEEIKPKGIVIL